MQRLRRWLFASLLAAALFFAACTPLFAQNLRTEPDAAKGSLTGRLTDLNSAPLAGVAVVLRNGSTGAETRTITTRNGIYHFAALDAGEYTLAAESAQLGRGQVEGVVISGGHEARVQAAIDFKPESVSAPALAASASPAQSREPAAVARAVEPPTREPAPRVEASQASAPAQASSLPVAAALSAPQPSPQPAPSAPVQFAAVEPVTLKQPAVEHEVLQPEPPAQPAASASATKAPVAVALPASTPPASSTIETVAAALPAAIPSRPASTPAPGVSPSLAAITSAASGVQPMIRTKPIQLLPIVAAIARVDPVISVLQTTVSATEVAALPEAGRNWQNFALETPATSQSSDSSGPVYRGEDQAPAEITIDGAPTRLAFGAAADTTPSNPDSGTHGQSGTIGGLGGQAWNGGRGFSMTEAGVREVETVAGNVEAEAARGTGGRISMKTAQGENQVHGQAFLFDRQNTWGAQNPFTQWVTQTSEVEPLAPYNAAQFPVFDNFQYSSGQAGLPQSYTPSDHEMVWGLGLGGHILRNKLYWFAALDSDHRNDPGLAMVKHPYLLQCETSETASCAQTKTTGFFAAPSDPQLQLLSAQLDLPSASPVSEALVQYSNMLEALAGLLGPAPRSAAQWVGFGRIDWQAAERHRITLEGISADWNAPGGGLTQVSENYGSHSFGSSDATQQWLLARWEAYLTPNLLSTMQASAGHDILTAKPSTPSAFENSLLSGNTWGQLPQIVVDSRYGFTIGNPSRFGQGSYPDEKLYHAQELVDWVHNGLLIKAGFEVDHNADTTSLLRNQTGTYTYSKVEDFIADALVYQNFGLQDPNNYSVQHNCGPTDTTLGSQPCYSSYSQMMGPANWYLSTSDFAGYATAQWQPAKLVVASFGLRWEREKMPPPIAAVSNSELPLTQKLPDLGNNWGPRVSLAIGNSDGRLPVLRLGYGMYYGRVDNATIETALAQTGSLKGDLSFFMRPQDDCQFCSGGAPSFPYVLQGTPGTVVKPGAVEFASRFRNPEVHQAVVSVEETLPSHIQVTAAAIASLGRRLPVFLDANLAPPTQTITYAVCDQTPATAPGSSNTNGQCGNLGLGPIKATQITLPFYASNAGTGVAGWLNSDYQSVNQITSIANSTYEAAMLKVARYGRRGLSVRAHYTYAHAMDWNPDASPLNPSSLSQGSSFSQEYGTSNLDVRHSAAAMLFYETPWKLHKMAGELANGWMLSGIGQFHSGLPYTMHVTGSIPEGAPAASGNLTLGLLPGMNGSGGDNRVFGAGNDGIIYNIGRNTFRYPHTWKADLRLAKRFDLGKMRDLEIMAESFNLFNHQNVTEVETTGYTIDSGSPYPTLNFLTGLKVNATTGLPNPAFGQPLSINASDFFRERQIQFGLRMRF